MSGMKLSDEWDEVVRWGSGLLTMKSLAAKVGRILPLAATTY